VPIQMGNYSITLRQGWGTYDNKIILGNYTIANSGFSPTQITKTELLSPLKQFKSGTPAQSVQCKHGFQLVIKTEDGSPACVKPTSIKKLVSLQWALKPVNELTVEEFKDTYKVGEKIDFAIKFKGFASCGFPPSFMVKNTLNETVWTSPTKVQFCDTDTGYGEPKWKFGELETLIINQTGSYTMNISISDKTLEKGFAVVQ